ncbi:MAG: glycosyltransferase [Acidobacteriota bacterium]|nr:glycosyltransferase [Acidobacteriota bacterium]
MSRILIVAYPPLPEGENSVLGGEDVVRSLTRELRLRGHHVDVASCPGGGGALNAPGSVPECACQNACLRQTDHDRQVLEACAAQRYHAVLDHSGHFFRHAAEVDGFVLATLHLPRAAYPAEAFRNPAPNVYFICVSESQREEFRDLPRLMPVIHNGVELRRLEMGRRRAGYVLWLGRVSRQKAPHLAIDAAEKAGLPLLLAGQLGTSAEDKAYWQNEVLPRVDHDRVRWAEWPSFEDRVSYLRESRALLVTSQEPEVSALMALEAMACGTPVVSFPAGAMREVVTPETGFLVNGVEEMAAACHNLRNIRALDCRVRVHEHYSITAMAEAYEVLMQELEEQKQRIERLEE